MKINGLFIVLAMIFLNFSCTKEISREQDDDPVVDPPVSDTTSTPKDKLLVRLVTYEESFPQDSSVDTYTYDQNKRIIGLKSESFGPEIQNTFYNNSEHIFYRDAGGIIKRIAVIDRYYEGGLFTRIDSSVLELFYDPVSKHYTHCIETINLVPIYPGQDDRIRDSATYTYDGKDRIVRYQRFREDISTNTAFEGQRFDYTYDLNGNISKLAFNENFDNSGDPLVESLLEYDDKINPFVKFGNDALLMGILSVGIPSSNNCIKSTTRGINDVAMAYMYDADNYPVKAIATYIDVQEKAITYFYYQ
ncbi:MAG: hypothetical protein J0I84_17225 [Terrimonas sp.]|nr:hypothetical protein [Terrimonas sp.]OJY92880.1 MAG: hypothetical protein BGP13_21030 [Sphingobacteriales bacterium 40-81]